MAARGDDGSARERWRRWSGRPRLRVGACLVAVALLVFPVIAAADDADTAIGSPTASPSGDFGTMALLDVQPSSYDWGSLRVGEVGPWVEFSFELGPPTAVDADLGVELDTSGGYVCGDRFCNRFRFKPHHRGPINANIYVRNTDTDETTVVPTTGIGLDTQVGLSLGSLAFGDQNVDTTSASQTVSFDNVGDFDVDVTGIEVTAPFVRTGGTCTSGSLASGTSCSIDIAFAPTSEGPASGTVSVTTVQEDPVTAGLTGTGVGQGALVVSPSAFVFDDTAIGATSSPVMFSVQNQGSAPVTISSIAVTADWLFTSTCPSVVAVGGSCEVHVSFSPSERGLRSGILQITSAPTVTASLEGSGRGGDFSVAPVNLDFGSVDVGATSREMTVQVTNAGWIETQAQLATSGPFSVVSSTCGVLAPNASCTAVVAFSPTAPGAAVGSLTVTGLPTPQQAIPLTGFGAEPSATIPPVDVGDVDPTPTPPAPVPPPPTPPVPPPPTPPVPDRTLPVTGATSPFEMAVAATALILAGLTLTTLRRRIARRAS